MEKLIQILNLMRVDYSRRGRRNKPYFEKFTPYNFKLIKLLQTHLGISTRLYDVH